MDKKGIVEALSALLQDSETEITRDTVSEMKKDFEALMANQQEEQLAKHLESGAEKDAFVYQTDEYDAQLEELIAAIQARWKAAEKERAASFQANLEAREELLAQMRQLIAEEENIGKAFQAFRGLQDKWKEAGDVHSSRFKELQKEYGKLGEEFFYNIKIYKELKENDLKKNHELKEVIISKAEALAKLDKIRQIEISVELLVHDWNAIGPTHQEKWADVRDRFWSAVGRSYERIREHYKQLRETQKEHQKAKEDLCDKAEVLAALEITNHAEWQQKTDEIKELQQLWKGTGYVPKKLGNLLWARFRGACDAFFQKKKTFFEAAQGEFDGHKQKKIELIERVAAINGEVDWKRATADVIRIQKQWKEVGRLLPRDEQKLWKRFRKACDGFFDAKDAYFKGLREVDSKNLEQKEALLKEMGDWKFSGEKKADMEKVKAFNVSWGAIGRIPKDKVADVDGQFTKTMNGWLKEMGMKGDEQERTRMSLLIERSGGDEEAERRLFREQKTLDDKIKRLKDTIIQYENNLGFFKYTDDNHPMKKEVMDNIERSKTELEKLEKQQRNIRSALKGVV